MVRGNTAARLHAAMLRATGVALAGSLALALAAGAAPAAGTTAHRPGATAAAPPDTTVPAYPVSTHSLPGLRYQAHDHPGPVLSWRQARHRGSPFSLADVDGDGRPELVSQMREGILLRRHDGLAPVTLDQFNLPPGYVAEIPTADIIAFDARADGTDEVAVVAPHQDGTHWRLWIIDLVGQRVLGDMTLPALPGRRRDGVWDGAYIPLGSVSPPGAKRPLLVLLRTVGHDIHGRGVLAIDPLAAEVVWQRNLDGRPHGYCSLVDDLDGDGHEEIVVGTAAVNNLEGRRLYGASDDSSRVLVLEADGRTRWQRAFGGPGSGLYTAATDLDGRPGKEVVVSSGNTDPSLPSVCVLDADGRMLAQYGRDRRRAGVLAVLTAPDAPTRLAVRYTDLHIDLLGWRDGALVRLGARTVNREQNGLVALDVLPTEPGQEAVIVGGGQVLVCDRDLRTLAGVRLDAVASRPFAMVWPVEPDLAIFLPYAPTARPVVFAPAPRQLHPAWFAGSGLLALGTAGLWWRRRTHRRAGRVETDPVVLRELRLQLLARLAKGGHEKIGALQALRRLVWRLDAEVAQAAAAAGVGAGSGAGPGAGSGAGSGAGVGSGTRAEAGDGAGAGPGAPGGAVASRRAADRLAPALATLTDDTIPRLREILVLGRRTGAPTHLLNTGADILDDLAALPADAHRGLPHLHDRATTLAREAEATLQRLRRAVESNFRSDLAACFARVLAAQQETLDTLGITVVLPPAPGGGSAPDDGPAPAGGPWVAMDSQDVEFVLDNLVGNAARAMEDAAVRRLVIAWDQPGNQVICTVTDTGLGIAPEDHEAIFEDGWSDRPGGGYGLARSRRDLHLHGGNLRVLESRAGHGTTFELTLPAAGPPA